MSFPSWTQDWVNPCGDDGEIILGIYLSKRKAFKRFVKEIKSIESINPYDMHLLSQVDYVQSFKKKETEQLCNWVFELEKNKILHKD